MAEEWGRNRAELWPNCVLFVACWRVVSWASGGPLHCCQRGQGCPFDDPRPSIPLSKGPFENVGYIGGLIFFDLSIYVFSLYEGVFFFSER
jgi:hypothetical protein